MGECEIRIRNEELEVGRAHLTPPVLWLTAPANFVPNFSLIFVGDGVFDVPDRHKFYSTF